MHMNEINFLKINYDNSIHCTIQLTIHIFVIVENNLKIYILILTLTTDVTKSQFEVFEYLKLKDSAN